MRKLIRRLHYWIHRAQSDAELAEEMEFHRAMHERESGSAGRRAMGNITMAREDARAVWIWPWIESIWQDFAHGLRVMRKQPAFTVVALLALGSAIGVNTSLFTVFNVEALRPWPVSDPARVVNIAHADGAGFSIAAYRYAAERTKAFSGVIAMRNGSRVLLGSEPLQLTCVSGNYFGVLGVEMARGRGFRTDEDHAGAPQAVAVIAYDSWQNRFGGDPDIAGKQIRLDDVPFTVVGVASRHFTGTSPLRNDVWVPLASWKLLRPNDPSVTPFLTSPAYCCSPMAGRLAPEITRQQARAEVELLLGQFRAQSEAANRSTQSAIVLAGTSGFDRPDGDRSQSVPLAAMMAAAVILVLLLACANVGNLLLARAAARRREIAIRLSVGGSRMRVIRQLLVESFALALAAAAIGLAIAWVLPSFIASRVGDEISYRFAPDLRVLAYAILTAFLACLAFGLAPALHATRGNIYSALKEQTRLAGVRLSLRSVLLSAQVSISVMLLAGAGLLARGLQRAEVRDPGFAVRDVTVVSFDLPANAYGGDRTRAFVSRLRQALEAPGMPVAGLATEAPLNGGTSRTDFRREGEDRTRNIPVQFHSVSRGYFDALRIPLVAGRNFVPADAGRLVVLINQTMAKRFWPEGSPVGRMLISNGAAREIAGVVRDASTTQLGSIEPVMYWPMDGTWMPVVLVRDRAAGGVEKVASVLRQIEPRAQVHSEALERNLQRSLQSTLLGAALAGALGLLALLLASIGMSGVFAYAVRQRTREIGIRMALGAHPRDAIRLVLASSLRAMAAGILLGLAAAAGISKLLASRFLGVSPFDPAAYAGVVILLALAGLTASAVPARRAARVDPVTALRCE